MDNPQQPKPTSPVSGAAPAAPAAPLSHDARMQALLRLRAQMEELHAHLEYMKLMLRLKDKGRRAP